MNEVGPPQCTFDDLTYLSPSEARHFTKTVGAEDYVA